VEGLDQTIKMPARTDRYFDRLQEAVNSQPAAETAYPDIKALMTRVHAQLEKEPVLLQLKSGAEYLLQRRDMQELAGSFIADPKGAALLLGFYRTLDNGDTLSFDNVPSRFLLERLVDPGKPISMGAMSTAMDIASGMTANRKAEISVQAETSLLGSYLNFTYHFDGMVPELDLGDEFRAKPVSDVPVMLLSGTLDGRTYVESQLEAVSELTNVTAVAVKNAGHNLFMSSDEVQEAINRFMEDKPQLKDTITIELPEFAPQQ
jgi:pimeloyl-ACP methyl ester carboxylesterase